MKEKKKSPPPTQSIKVQYIVQLRTNYLASIFSSRISGGSIQIVVLHCLVSQKCAKNYLEIQNLQIICRMLLCAILLFGSYDNKDIFFDKKKLFVVVFNDVTIQWLCFSLPFYFSLICTLLNVHAVHRSQIATFIICLESKKNCYLYFYSQLHCCKTYTVYLFIDQYIL